MAATAAATAASNADAATSAADACTYADWLPGRDGHDAAPADWLSDQSNAANVNPAHWLALQSASNVRFAIDVQPAPTTANVSSTHAATSADVFHLKQQQCSRLSAF